MRRHHVLLASFMVALVAAALPARAAGATPPPASNDNDHVLRIGVVNTARIVHGMKEIKKIEDDFRAQNVDLARQQQQKEQDINNLMKQRENVRPGSAQWQDDTNEIDRKTADLSSWIQLAKVQLERQRKLQLKMVYDHIAAATAQVAQAQRLNLVIADESPEFLGPDLDKITFERLNQVLEARAVLYADKKADITEDVLTLVEANFARQNQGVGALINPTQSGIGAH